MRRSSLDKGSVTAGLTNEAYDDVKKVADNLDDILLVASNLTSLTSFSVHPTEDGGDGTVEGDMNAMDWTGHSHADDLIVTALRVEYTENLIISHKGLLYYYRGAKPELLGVGGSLKTSDAYGILATVEELNLALKFPAGDLANPELGNVAARQNRFLGFDANGEIIFSAGTAAVDSSAVALVDLGGNYASVQVEDAFAELASTDGAAIVGITDLGTYFTGTTIEAALQELGATDAADRLINVTLNDTQTLANKTLNSVVLDTGVSGTAIDSTVTTSATKIPTSEAVSNFVGGRRELVMLDTPIIFLNIIPGASGNWVAHDLGSTAPAVIADGATEVLIQTSIDMTVNTVGAVYMTAAYRRTGSATSAADAPRIAQDLYSWGTTLHSEKIYGNATVAIGTGNQIDIYMSWGSGGAGTPTFRHTLIGYYK